MENSEKKIDFAGGENPQAPRKPNLLVCFFEVLAHIYFGGFIGLVAGEEILNRFLGFVSNIFFLTIESLPVVLFVSYFLITLPTWLFVLVIVAMAANLCLIVLGAILYRDDYIKRSKKKQQKVEKQAKNHAKFYEYGDKFYKNKPTTLIGDFFRIIGNIYFGGFVGKNFLSGENIYRETKWKSIYCNILHIIVGISFWITVVSCFLITVPKWLFVLAIVAVASKLVVTFCNVYFNRQKLRTDIYFFKYQNENEWATSFQQVDKENRYNKIPSDCEVIEKTDIL